jgi:hypothetical protein
LVSDVINLTNQGLKLLAIFHPSEADNIADLLKASRKIRIVAEKIPEISVS